MLITANENSVLKIFQNQFVNYELTTKATDQLSLIINCTKITKKSSNPISFFKSSCNVSNKILSL